MAVCTLCVAASGAVGVFGAGRTGAANTGGGATRGAAKADAVGERNETASSTGVVGVYVRAGANAGAAGAEWLGAAAGSALGAAGANGSALGAAFGFVAAFGSVVTGSFSASSAARAP